MYILTHPLRMQSSNPALLEPGSTPDADSTHGVSSMYAQKSPVNITISAPESTAAACCNDDANRFFGVSQSAFCPGRREGRG